MTNAEKFVLASTPNRHWRVWVVEDSAMAAWYINGIRKAKRSLGVQLLLTDEYIESQGVEEVGRFVRRELHRAWVRAVRARPWGISRFASRR